MLRLAFALICFASFVPCQEEGESGAQGHEAERRMKAAEAAKVKELADRGEKSEIDDSKLTPEQRLARHVISGAGQYCRFLATVSPRKLLPGQTGTLRVLATLQGHAVLPAPAPLEFVGLAEQGAVSLGPMQMQPATVGRLESGYLGRPVYENYAILEMPVTMANTAQMGSKQVVSVDMKFDLYDGTSGHPLGRFLDRVSTDIDVGLAVDPAVRGAAPREDTAKPTPTPPANVAKPIEAEKPPLPVRAVDPPVEKTPTPAPAPAPTPITPMPVEDAGGPLPMPVWLGGGALLLGVLVLLVRRK